MLVGRSVSGSAKLVLTNHTVHFAQGKLHASAFVHCFLAPQVSSSLTWTVAVRTFYYSKGTQIYCAPTVDARPVWQNTMVHIALEGRCFVLSACQYAQEKDYPLDHAVRNVETRNGENVMIAGGSVIVSPLGKILAGPLLEGEGVLTAELDLDDIPRGKFDLDVVGHYARSDSESSVFFVRACRCVANDIYISQYSSWR